MTDTTLPQDPASNPHVTNAGYSILSSGPGVQILAWKCPHLSVYSGLHTWAVDAPPELVEQTKMDLLAYYQVTASCGCVPVINPP